MKTTYKLVLTAISALFLISCNKELPPGDYDANEIGKVKKVIPGMIISKRAVNLHRKNADELNHQAKAKDNYVDNGYNQTHGMEYVIKLNSGGIISVVQNEDLKFKNKQKILVIYGKNTRVVADNGSD